MKREKWKNNIIKSFSEKIGVFPTDYCKPNYFVPEWSGWQENNNFEFEVPLFLSLVYGNNSMNCLRLLFHVTSWGLQEDCLSHETQRCQSERFHRRRSCAPQSPWVMVTDGCLALQGNETASCFLTKRKANGKDRSRDMLIARGMERSLRGCRARDLHTVPLRSEFADKYWLC